MCVTVRQCITRQMAVEEAEGMFVEKKIKISFQCLLSSRVLVRIQNFAEGGPKHL